MQFAALVHDRTREETTVLLFVSVSRRHVEIIPDRAIAERITATECEGIIGKFLPKLSAGRFPPQAGKGNEMPDVVTEA